MIVIDDIKSQSDTVFIQAAGFVGLVEAVEHLRNFVLGKSLPGVFDADPDPAVLDGVGNLDI
jgi:hypothetical protein